MIFFYCYTTWRGDEASLGVSGGMVLSVFLNLLMCGHPSIYLINLFVSNTFLVELLFFEITIM